MKISGIRFLCPGLLAALSMMKALAGNPSSETLLSDAWKQYRMGEFDKAVSEFQTLQKISPSGSESEIQGIYGEATCWNFRGESRNAAKALSLYERLIQKAPENPLAPWVALDIVRARYLGKVDSFSDTPEIVRAYGDIYARYPDAEAGEEAFLFQSNLSFQGINQTQARDLIQNINLFLEKHPASHYRSYFFGLQAKCFNLLDQQTSRLEAMIQSLKTREIDRKNPSSNFSQQYWEIAYVAEFEAGNFAVAREYYGLLIKEYPGNLRIFGAKQALQRMDRVEKAVREGAALSPEVLKGPIQ